MCKEYKYHYLKYHQVVRCPTDCAQKVQMLHEYYNYRPTFETSADMNMYVVVATWAEL